MEANKIQSSSYLDILFEGRNKSYGSYELRTNYPKRVKRAMAFLLLVGLLIAGYYAYASIKPKASDKPKPIMKQVTLAEPPPIDETKPPPPPPPEAPPPPVKPTVKFTPPVIKEDEEVKEDEVIADKKELEEAVAGVKTQEGDPNGIDVPIDNLGTGTQIVEGPAYDPSKIETIVDQQPEFPGDVRSYLADKLNYPDQAREAGIEGRVVVRFVVDEEGAISQASVQRGIGGGCDEEALRVVRGMPKWKPAKLNGRAVKSYFSLPIKFTLE